MSIYDTTKTNVVIPNLPFITHKQCVAPWANFGYEDNTSSKTLSYESGTIDSDSNLEPNTSFTDYNEISTSLEQPMEKFAPWIETIKPSMEVLSFIAERIRERMRPTMEALSFISERIAERMIPTMEALSFIAERMEPILKGLELLSIYREDKDVLRYENIVEPIDFHIKTIVKDDLIIDSIEDTKALLDDFKNVKVDKELSKYFTKRLNE